METHDLEEQLEALRQVYPDPLSLPGEIDDLLALAPATRLLASGDAGRERLLEFVGQTDRDDLRRVAVILLSRLGPMRTYPWLIEQLRTADERFVHSLEPGLWMLPYPEATIAKDILSAVEESGNAAALLLLQRPTAALIKPRLKRLVERRELPLSRYALYALLDHFDSTDRELLVELSRWAAAPDVAGLAGVQLLRLGSTVGLAGIRAALLSDDPETRRATLAELAPLLPKSSLEVGGFHPPSEPDPSAIDRLLATIDERIGQTTD